jgi:hypothetical protein
LGKGLRKENDSNQIEKPLMTRHTDPDNLPEIPQRIQKGATLLDQKLPNWHLQINLEHFHMNWCFSCIIGQLFTEGYIQGITSLGLNLTNIDDSQQEHGFEAYGYEDTEKEYQQLTNAWLIEIVKRRQAA